MQRNSAVANKANVVRLRLDIAGRVAAMTESELGVASEKTSHNILG